jgi:hypothetical protein
MIIYYLHNNKFCIKIIVKNYLLNNLLLCIIEAISILRINSISNIISIQVINSNIS